MKKIFLIIATITAVSTVSAQSTFGIKGGLNVSKTDSESEAAVAYYAGFIADYPVSDSFSFSPEILFSMQGAKGGIYSEGVYYDSRINLAYINVPLLAKFKTVKGLSFEFGPQIGLCVSAKDKLSTGGYEVDVDIKDQLQTIDFSLCVGATYMFNEKVGMQMRYNAGLTKLLKDDDYDDSDRGNNRVFQAGLVYMF